MNVEAATLALCAGSGPAARLHEPQHNSIALAQGPTAAWFLSPPRKIFP